MGPANIAVPTDGLSENKNIPLFTFSAADYIAKQSGLESEFDRMFQLHWTSASNSGVMKYNIVQQALPSKLITTIGDCEDDGNYGFVASLIEGRAPGKRRTPQEMLALRMPFNPVKFNFTKIEPNEVLFRIQTSDDDSSTRHTVIVNKSPIEFCSALLVPSLEQCLPQVLTEESLRLAIQVLALSDRQSLRLGFNSLGAMASVNHQHWHLYYFDYKLTIEDLPVRNHILQKWPIPAIVFELHEINDYEIANVVNRGMKIIDFCIETGQIAHNLFLSRTSTGAIRLFIWLVEPRFGTKNDLNINPAFCEFSGYFICKTPQLYATIDEPQCVQFLLSITSKHEEVLHLL